MLNDPKVLPAIIAGIVALVISSISGFYTLSQNGKRFDDLRKEIIIKASTERFIQEKISYASAYRDFESEISIIHKNNSSDGTITVQFAIDFFTGNARDFYFKNREILKTNELDILLNEMDDMAASGSLNKPNNSTW